MRTKKYFVIFILVLFALFLFTTKSEASLYLNNLDFNVQINSNGSMDVTETWNIDVSNTNTLYKTFKLDSSKYTNITNVTVSEIGKGNFTKTNTWNYHLTKNYYFGGINNDGEFEIAWGVGLDNSSATKTYKISYKVIDAVSKYNDCAELYWQFLGSDFEIDSSKITGTIKLPTKANSKEDIKVWGHVKTLNGDINITNLDTVEFRLNNYSSKNYVEVRIAIPTQMIETSGRVYNQNKLQSIIEEETVWANEANAIRQRQEKTKRAVIRVIIIASIIIAILLIMQTVKYIKILKNTKKLIPSVDYEYFREKPNGSSTPADALFLYNNGVNINYTHFGNVFSATLLNLSLKKYFEIKVEKDEKGKEQIIISRTNRSIEELSYEEEKIARFLKNAMGNENEITIKKLQKYIKNHGDSVSRLIENTGEVVKSKSKNEGKYDQKISDKKLHYSVIATTCFIFAIFTIVIFPVSILLIINAILAILINRKLNRLTQEGIDESTKWKGLKRYMEDFSLLNEKEVPALEVWEEYLVYATVFGIANKVIKQLKIVYPQIEQMDSFSTLSYVYLMSHTDFNSSFNSAISSSISSTMSSGSGAGGGFSGGGGGGRRPVEADGGR